MAMPSQAGLLRIYTKERAVVGDDAVHHLILERALRDGLAGATILRGPLGYGEAHQLHVGGPLPGAGDLPLIIEIADAEDRLRSFTASLSDIADIGLVTLERVEVLHHGKASAPPSHSSAHTSDAD